MKTHRVPFIPVLVIMSSVGGLLGILLRNEPAWLFISLLLAGVVCALTLDRIER